MKNPGRAPARYTTSLQNFNGVALDGDDVKYTWIIKIANFGVPAPEILVAF